LVCLEFGFLKVEVSVLLMVGGRLGVGC